jgi:hypothetical protein
LHKLAPFLRPLSNHCAKHPPKGLPDSGDPIRQDDLQGQVLAITTKPESDSEIARVQPKISQSHKASSSVLGDALVAIRSTVLSAAALPADAAGVPPRPLSKNLINLIPDLFTSRRLEISHRAFHVRVTKPLLNRAQVNSRPQAARGERGAEFV